MKRIAASLAAVLTALAVAGCGGDGAEPDAPPGGAPPVRELEMLLASVRAGQPLLLLADGAGLRIADTRKCKDAEGRPTAGIAHVPAPGQEAVLARLAPGSAVTARIDWERRHRLMRFHTATHLLCHLVPQLVNGCSITGEYARLDFNMTDPLDKEQLSAGIARLVASGLPVQQARREISPAALADDTRRRGGVGPGAAPVAARADPGGHLRDRARRRPAGRCFPNSRRPRPGPTSGTRCC